MIFNIIASTVSVNKSGEAKGTRLLSFEVVPKGRECLEIGNKHVVSEAGYHRLLHRDRERVKVSVQVTANRSYIQWNDEPLDKEVCGWAKFYPEHQGHLDYSPPALEIIVAVEPELFDELFKLRIGAPDAATMHVGINDLEFGQELDGSHEIWKLDEKSNDRANNRKPVKSFWVSLCTFSATESAIAVEIERKEHEELARSPDPEVRKLATDIAPKEDTATKLLRQCRIILLAILAAVLVTLLKR